jgi:PadR family transcriptional regulator PadR
MDPRPDCGGERNAPPSADATSCGPPVAEPARPAIPEGRSRIFSAWAATGDAVGAVPAPARRIAGQLRPAVDGLHRETRAVAGHAFASYLPIVLTGVVMTPQTGELLQGTLGILILKALLAGSAHGYGIARWVEQATDDVLRIEEGSLYPALRRLEDRGWVRSEWGLSENNRRARYYTITATGRAHLRAEAAVWLRYAGAVTRVLRVAPSLA